ncbi:UxaA family hydrolase [Halomontanus rarus]|uniref:UxaA family hydrolase n=1 Tax=Halomontanus rarus TaxID=3034020 RepID=UPI0023E78D93|nr:UxaA family hydrolase [Halovivax sp. TS33]
MTESGAGAETEPEARTRRAAIELDGTDTVVTVLEDAETGDVVGDDGALELTESVPFGHKVALVDHEPGDEIRKYGEVIGVATESVEPGEWVHTHNCDSARGKAEGRR